MRDGSLKTNYGDVVRELRDGGSDIEVDDPYSASNVYMALEWFPDWVKDIEQVEGLIDLLKSGVEELSGETVGLAVILVDALCAFPSDEPDVEERNRLIEELRPLLFRLTANVEGDVRLWRKEQSSGRVRLAAGVASDSSVPCVRSVLSAWMDDVDGDDVSVDEILGARARLDDAIDSIDSSRSPDSVERSHHAM